MSLPLVGMLGKQCFSTAESLKRTLVIVPVQEGRLSLEHRPDLLKRAEPRICAFDIETTKLPLQFPNADYDQVSQQSRVSF